MNGTRHAGVGYVAHSASLQSLKVKSAAGLLSESVYAPGSAPSHTARMRFEAPAVTFSPTSYVVGETSIDIGTITVRIPAHWVDVYLEMDGPDAAVSTWALDACPDPSSASSGGVYCVPDPLRNSFIVVFDGSENDPGSIAAAHSAAFEVDTTFIYQHALKGYAGTAPFPSLAAIKASSSVGIVERSDPGQLAVESTSTGARRVKAVDKTNTGENVHVAIVDTGIDSTHPDLASSTIGGGNIAGARNCQGGLPLDAPALDVYGHGTAVAGVVAALKNDQGFVGAAPDAKLVGIKMGDVAQVSYQGEEREVDTFEEAQAVCGLDAIVGWNEDTSNASRPIRVANMSFHFGPSRRALREFETGYDCPSPGDPIADLLNQDALHVAVCGAYDSGVTLVAAAGNARNLVREVVPAGYPQVIAATGLADTDGAPCGQGPASSRGNDDTLVYAWGYPGDDPIEDGGDQGHTIAAPGVDIDTTWSTLDQDSDPANPYKRVSGTSFSAPHVSGVAALAIKQFMDDNNGTPPHPSRVLELLKNNAEPPNISGGECAPGIKSHTAPPEHPEGVVRADNF